MSKIDHIISSPRMHMLTGVALSSLWIFFAVAHFSVLRVTGKMSLLVFCIAETMIAVFLLIRTRPRTFTMNSHEWIVAVLGTFLPLLFRPTTDTAVAAAEWGLILGSTMQIAGVLSLNRSFALIPALRELKTEGMYRFVRHPIYSSYLVAFSSYLAANFSSRNLPIALACVSLMLARVHFEERHLAQTPEYRAYRSRVRWRLIPFVY
jgi:protein-S-isoprenylcysteine O-methyltransferase Ste14